MPTAIHGQSGGLCDMGMAGGPADKGPPLLIAWVWHYYCLIIALCGTIMMIYYVFLFVFTGESVRLKLSATISDSVTILVLKTD